MTYRGEERTPLDLTGLAAILDGFRAENVEAIAVCLLHSYAKTSHEEEVVSAIKDYWPEVLVVASHQICREWREYERTNTAVTGNLYVMLTYNQSRRNIFRESKRRWRRRDLLAIFT